MAASPQLHHLRVDGAGQALLASLLKSVEAAPSHTLDVSLHHGVNPLPLLYSPLRYERCGICVLCVFRYMQLLVSGCCTCPSGMNGVVVMYCVL